MDASEVKDKLNAIDAKLREMVLNWARGFGIEPTGVDADVLVTGIQQRVFAVLTTGQTE